MSAVAPLISIIMPAYNVDAYIHRAIESIQHQTLEDWELFVIDDGSRDRTGQIADAMAERDIRLTVLHQKNAGAPMARNRALERARGRYVLFFDADDWAEPHMLEDLSTFATQERLELVISGFYIDTYYGKDTKNQQFTSEIKSCPNKVYATQQDFRVGAWQLFDANQLYPPWNKLFLRERIEELRIRFKQTFWDDFPFVLDYIRDVNKVGVLQKPYYHFIRQRSESETSRWRPDMYQKREEEHTWMLELYKHWGLEADPASSEMIYRRYAERLVGCIENVCEPSCELPYEQKIALIQQMISTPQAQLAVSIARPRTRMLALLFNPIKSQNAQLAYRQGMLISFVKRHNTKLFATLKARR